MPPSGNFGSVSLEGGQLRAVGNSAELEGYVTVSLHIAIVQGTKVVPGPAQVSGGNWTTDPPLAAKELSPGEALGLASQTLIAEGTPPSFLTLTWSEQIPIAGEGE